MHCTAQLHAYRALLGFVPGEMGKTSKLQNLHAAECRPGTGEVRVEVYCHTDTSLDPRPGPWVVRADPATPSARMHAADTITSGLDPTTVGLHCFWRFIDQCTSTEVGIRLQSSTPKLLFSLSICCSLTTKFENILIEAPIKAHLLLPATRSRVSLTVVSRNAGCELQHRLMREQVSVANRREIFYHPSKNILHTLAVVVSKA